MLEYTINLTSLTCNNNGITLRRVLSLWEFLHNVLSYFPTLVDSPAKNEYVEYL
jgi:hypothetical protein